MTYDTLNNELIYGFSKAVHELAEAYINKEILKCDSGLIDALLSYADEDGTIGSNFNYEKIENIYYISPKWISDLSKQEQDLLTLYNLRTMEDLNDFMEADKGVDSDGNEITIADEHLDVLDDIHHVWKYRDSEAQEVLEWWAITRWLADHLIAIGEPVIINDYGHWWGRTCSGQPIILDGTIQKIAEKFI